MKSCRGGIVIQYINELFSQYWPSTLSKTYMEISNHHIDTAPKDIQQQLTEMRYQKGCPLSYTCMVFKMNQIIIYHLKPPVLSLAFREIYSNKNIWECAAVQRMVFILLRTVGYMYIHVSNVSFLSVMISGIPNPQIMCHYPPPISHPNQEGRAILLSFLKLLFVLS